MKGNISTFVDTPDHSSRRITFSAMPATGIISPGCAQPYTEDCKEQRKKQKFRLCPRGRKPWD